MNLFTLTRTELAASLIVVSLLIWCPMTIAQPSDTVESLPEAVVQTPGSAEVTDDAAIPSSDVSEADNTDLIVQKHPFTLENQTKDPFKPLIVKPKPVVVVVDNSRQEEKKRIDPPPEIKPLVVNVQGICGNEGSRWALVTYNNQVRVVTQDMVVDGAFKVVAIDPDRLIVYSNKHQSRQTFPLTK